MEQVDVSKFPPESSLSQPGSRDGQQKIVRNGSGGADAYGWSAALQAWQKIGEVTGRAAASKVDFEGKQYDHVLPVAMDDGAPSLKIAFNNSDDASAVARAFIARHGLQSQVLQQIVDFVKNAQQPVAIAGARSSFPCVVTLPSSAPVPSAAVIPKLMAKISQFNSDLSSTPELQLTPQELDGLEVPKPRVSKFFALITTSGTSVHRLLQRRVQRCYRQGCAVASLQSLPNSRCSSNCSNQVSKCVAQSVDCS
jgi:hypothetical protein